MNPLKKRNVPWWIWVASAAAVAILIVPFGEEETRAVHVVGAGAVAAIEASDAPEGFAYRLRTVPSETLAETAVRFENILEIRPTAVVVGFDAQSIGDLALPGSKAIVHAVVVAAERNPAPVYMLPFISPLDADAEFVNGARAMNDWMADEICDRKKIRCIEMPVDALSERAAHRALRDVISRALTTVERPTPAPAPADPAEPQASL